MAVPELSREDAKRQIRQLEARLAHHQVLAAELTRHGFKGAAAKAMLLVTTLQGQLDRTAGPLAATLPSPLIKPVEPEGEVSPA